MARSSTPLPRAADDGQTSPCPLAASRGETPAAALALRRKRADCAMERLGAPVHRDTRFSFADKPTALTSRTSAVGPSVRCHTSAHCALAGTTAPNGRVAGADLHTFIACPSCSRKRVLQPQPLGVQGARAPLSLGAVQHGVGPLEHCLQCVLPRDSNGDSRAVVELEAQRHNR